MDVKYIEYKDIKPKAYTIDEYGNIYSCLSNKYLKCKTDKDGYYCISLVINNKKRGMFRVATLVACTFIGLPPIDMIDPTINHIDSNKINNHYSNLEWMERGENSSIRLHTGKGTENHEAKLNEDDVAKICDLLIDGKYNMEEIANIFNVHKSTISNIKRHKNWNYISDNYNFQIKSVKSKKEIEKQKAEIFNFFVDGYSTYNIVKMGYPQTTVYRYHKQYIEKFGSTGR